MHLGVKIKVLRLSKGLSQQELADKVNKTRPLISHIEQKGKVNAETLKLICKALGVSLSDLENLVNEPEKINNADASALQKEIQQLRKENEVLLDLVESQKQVIALLKKR